MWQQFFYYSYESCTRACAGNRLRDLMERKWSAIKVGAVSIFCRQRLQLYKKTFYSFMCYLTFPKPEITHAHCNQTQNTMLGQYMLLHSENGRFALWLAPKFRIGFLNRWDYDTSCSVIARAYSCSDRGISTRQGPCCQLVYLMICKSHRPAHPVVSSPYKASDRTSEFTNSYKNSISEALSSALHPFWSPKRMTPQWKNQFPTALNHWSIYF